MLLLDPSLEAQKRTQENSNILLNFDNKVLKDKFTTQLKKNMVLKKYIDQSVYQGELRNEKRNGKGRYDYPNGDVYVGQWKNDKFHGQGVFIYQN